MENRLKNLGSGKLAPYKQSGECRKGAKTMWEVGLISEKYVYRKMRLPLHSLTSGGTDPKKHILS